MYQKEKKPESRALCTPHHGSQPRAFGHYPVGTSPFSEVRTPSSETRGTTCARPKLALVPRGAEPECTLEFRYACRLGSEAICDGLHIMRFAACTRYAWGGESISIKDFMRAHAYASLHALDRKNTELVFVSARYPRTLMRYLAKNRNYSIKHSTLGTYTIEGDLFPIRIIVDEQRVCGYDGGTTEAAAE
ncbi:MAG: hypothetical protein LBC99_03225 [Spirochaetota bacterium]|jgi:hypothetical protein|nr:hypothetical protein [Spirochaetota bacterium]